MSEPLPSARGRHRERPKICIIDDCNNKVRCRGLCNSHYRKWYMYGDINAPKKRRKSEQFEWLMDAIKQETDECINYPYSGSGGYGRLYIDGKLMFAHRYVCILENGEPPTDKHQAAHSCGNGHLGCVNKRHLSWKTCAENNADKREHGTQLEGSTHPQAKLTEHDVLWVKSQRGHFTRAGMADLLRVSRATIDGILDGRYWTHV